MLIITFRSRTWTMRANISSGRVAKDAILSLRSRSIGVKMSREFAVVV